MPIRTMNKLPLRYAILMAGPDRIFLRSSHTSLERCRSRIREDMRLGSLKDWTWSVVELREAGSVDSFAPIPACTTIEGPYTIANPPAK